LNLWEIDFDEKLVTDFCVDFYNIPFNTEELLDLSNQANLVIGDKREKPEKRAEAYIKIFQLLVYQYILAPKNLENALTLCPNMPQALIRKGIFFYLKDKDKSNMQECVNKIIKQDPHYACAWLMRACITGENSEQYISDCTKYILLKPNSPLGYEKCANYYISRLYIKYGSEKELSESERQDIDKAISYLSKTIHLDPSNCYN